MELLKNFSILYIDNDKELISKAEQTLKNKIKNLYIVNNFKDAFPSYKKFNPDIVIVDVLSEKGINFCKELKSISNEQAIIVLTAQKNIVILEEIINLGVSKILFKPILKFDRLFQEIEAVCKILQNKLDANNLKLLKLKEEREEFLLGVIKQISHHWKQPLSIISTLSSTCSYKKEMGIETNIEEDVESAKLITRKTQELAAILEAIDNIDYKNITIEEIEQLIKVSNPLYPREKEKV